jgi:hypothetical protein
MGIDYDSTLVVGYIIDVEGDKLKLLKIEQMLWVLNFQRQ